MRGEPVLDPETRGVAARTRESLGHLSRAWGLPVPRLPEAHSDPGAARLVSRTLLKEAPRPTNEALHVIIETSRTPVIPPHIYERQPP